MDERPAWWRTPLLVGFATLAVISVGAMSAAGFVFASAAFGSEQVVLTEGGEAATQEAKTLYVWQVLNPPGQERPAPVLRKSDLIVRDLETGAPVELRGEDLSVRVQNVPARREVASFPAEPGRRYRVEASPDASEEALQAVVTVSEGVGDTAVALAVTICLCAPVAMLSLMGGLVVGIVVVSERIG